MQRCGRRCSLNPKQPTHQTRAGFTLVELMIATLLGSLLVVATGVMLSSSYRELEHSKSSLKLQREMTFAIDVLRQDIHNAAKTNISVTASQISIQHPGYVKTYTKQGLDLICDPNSTVSNDEIALIDGLLVNFSPVLETNLGIRTTLSLAQDGRTSTIQTLAGFRNE